MCWAILAGFLLSGAISQTAGAQAPPYIQIPVPWMPGAGGPRQDQRDYDRGRWEHCEGLRDREHEIRERLAYVPPYSKEREHLEHRLREVRYQREQCWHR